MPTPDRAPEWAPFLASKRASRERRRTAARARRTSLLRRRGVAVLAASMTLATTAALAQEDRGSVLRAGSNGSTVVALQRALGIPADGIYGPQTRRAVRGAQRRLGLAVDGIAGPATLAALGVRRVAVARTGTALLDRIAQCESGGDPTAVSADRRYRGKYQFTRATWRALGGTGDPARAPEAEQDARARALLAREGTAPWPSCA